MDGFDATTYWRRRFERYQGELRATGTSRMPERWQAWLYRAKERAYRRLLERTGTTVAGAAVLDFGCGTGHFETLWEGAGARSVAGIDIVPATIERLSAQFPRRRYVCADLGADGDVAALGPADLLTAIDVVYHIVDGASLERTLAKLLALLAPGGTFLFTDALVDRRPADHVAFRSATTWTRLLADHGLAIVDREPVAVVLNRFNPAAFVWPGLTGAIQYQLDERLLRWTPSLANNWAIVARRTAP